MKKVTNIVIVLTTLLLFTLMSSCSETLLPTENTNTPISTRTSLYKTSADCSSEITPVDLLAGQHMDVGDVNIWNDDINLYVEYIIDDDDWCITETHLHVAVEPEYLPQTKKGNAIPGKFDYKGEHQCETNVKYTISWEELGFDEGEYCDMSLYIAAHAVVKNNEKFVCEETNETGVLYGIHRNDGDIYGIDIVSKTAWLEFSSIAPPAGSAKPNGLAYDAANERMYYCTYQSTPTTLYFWDYSTGTENVAGNLGNVQIADADLYNGKYYYITGPPASDDLYEVAFNADGTILSNTKIGDIASNAHGWTFNGDIAVKDGVVYGWGKCATHNKYEFFTYDLTSSVFNFTTTAYQGFSMQLAFGSDGILYGHKSNASGNAYFYQVDITNGNLSNETLIDPDLAYTDCASGMICEPETETAWGDGEDFPGNDWSMYIIYDVCCPLDCDEWIIYGSNLGTGAGSDVLYAIDLNTKTRTPIYDPGAIDGSQNYPNANAYDPVNNRIYFGTSNGRLYYHEISSGTHVLVAPAINFGVMACGAWYNGKYYYVQNGTNRLYEFDGTNRTQIGTVPTSNGYGDIVFDPHNPGRFVGSAGSNAYWYAYDINTKTSWTLQNGGLGNHKQLAYGSDGTLYGVEATSGHFYIVEYSISAPSVTLTSFWESGFPFTDLASGPQCQ